MGILPCAIRSRSGFCPFVGHDFAVVATAAFALMKLGPAIGSEMVCGILRRGSLLVSPLKDTTAVSLTHIHGGTTAATGGGRHFFSAAAGRGRYSFNRLLMINERR